MGSPKQLLPVSGKPMLQAVVDALAASQVSAIVVVTRAAVAAELGWSSRDDRLMVFNEDEHSEMIDSVRIGLREVVSRTSVAAQDGYLVLPADQPGVAVEDINCCINVFAANPAKMVIASFERRGGHPMIFPAGLADVVQSPGCDAGLNVLARLHSDKVVKVECRSAAITRDVDTPADYRDSEPDGLPPRGA